LTLDQYLAQQKEKESAIPKLEGIRKANDGADDIWKNAVPLSKNEDEEAYYVGKTRNAPKARTKKEEKVYIEIDARFDRPERSRGRGRGDRSDRGGRGYGDRERGHGGRGRGGKTGRQDANGPAPDVDVEDRVVFPSLT
jgi:plasminogen activator inhibitor 1 RNA-binding protein